MVGMEVIPHHNTDNILNITYTIQRLALHSAPFSNVRLL